MKDKTEDNKGVEIDAFERLVGRQASDAERRRLIKVKAELGIKNNDAIWLVVLALQYHLSLFEIMPARIDRAAAEACRRVITAARPPGQRPERFGWPELLAGLLAGAVLGAAVAFVVMRAAS